MSEKTVVIGMTKENKNDKKVSLVSRLGYAFGAVGQECSWTLVSTYLSAYYTDVVGLMPVVVSAILLIARVWDAVNDPMFGSIAENSRFKKFGRYRGWILIGTPFLALFNCLTFLNLDISTPWKTFYCAITYILCGMAYTVVNISFGALSSSMTTNPQERTVLQSWRGIGKNIISFIMNAVALPIIVFFGNGSTSSSKGYFITAVIFSIVCIPCFIVCVASTREVIVPAMEQRKKGDGLKKAWTSFKIAFSDHDTRYLLLGMLFTLVGAIGRMGVLFYYFNYVLNNALLMAGSMTVMSVGAALSFLYIPSLVRRINKKTVGVLSSVALCICTLVFFFIGEYGWTMAVMPVSFLLGFTNVSPADFLIGDIIDDNWIRTGKRTDGVTYSTISFSTKFGSAIGGSIGILILGMVGFVANTQMDKIVLTKMNAVINLLPIVFFVAGGYCYARIRLTNKIAEKNEEIVKEMMLNQENS